MLVSSPAPLPPAVSAVAPMQGVARGSQGMAAGGGPPGRPSGHSSCRAQTGASGQHATALTNATVTRSRTRIEHENQACIATPLIPLRQSSWEVLMYLTACHAWEGKAKVQLATNH